MYKTDNYEKFKNFIKKEAKRLNINCTNAYKTFFAKTLLYYVTKQDKDKELIIKGSFASFVNHGTLIRPITDVDIASSVGHHKPLLTLVSGICQDSSPYKFDLKDKPKRTSTGIIHVPLDATFKKINETVNIDYRENYKAIMEKHEKEVPKIFEGDDEYTIIVPSLEETIAEKMCIVLETLESGEMNTRIKDFYDLHVLLNSSYDYDKFLFYFKKMLNLRNKATPEMRYINKLDETYYNKYKRIWAKTATNMNFQERASLIDVLYEIRKVLCDAILESNKSKYPIKD